MNEPTLLDGDAGFLGVDSYTTAENLPPGLAQEAVNMDFTGGDAKTRGAFMCVPELGNAPFNLAKDWTSRTSAADYSWNAVDYGHGLFVAVSVTGHNGDGVMTSPDGVTWTLRTSAGTTNQWSDVKFANNIFVAVGAGGGTEARVMTSPDGITWTPRTAAEATGWQSLSFGAGLFVAVANTGTNRVMTSPDGITWTARTAASALAWASIDFSESLELFVAVAADGVTSSIMTSPDGITWTTRTAPTTDQWRAVRSGGDRIVAVARAGAGGRVAVSLDGITWTEETAAAANDWRGLTFASGVFVAVSVDGTNRVMSSPDGAVWTSQSAAAANQWAAVDFAGGLFIALSQSGTGNRVMTSPAQTVYATGVFSSPSEIGANYTMLVGQSAVNFQAFGRTSKTVFYATGETVSRQSTVVQANNQVFIFRGPDEVPLVWNGKWATTFTEATGTIPNSHFAFYSQNRLWVLVGKDSLWASGVLDFTTFTEITNQFNLSAGDSNYLVTAYPFGDDAIVVFKNRSIILLQAVSGSLGDVVASEITRQVGAIGINAIVSVGPDLVYMSDRNINLLSLTTTNNSLQHKILPLSTPIQKILDRVNWDYGYKVSMGYWDNKLYVALPLDGATVCQSVVVYNFVTEKWYGEWNFDSSIGMSIVGWTVAPFLGLQKLQASTEDGKIFVLTDGYYDLMGTRQTNVESSLTTRAYRLNDSQRDGCTFAMDVSSHKPTISVTAYSSGSGYSVAAITDAAYRRSQTWKGGDTTYTLTNVNDDYDRAWRRDYAWTVSENVQCQSGFNPFRLQQARIPIRTRLRGRLSYFKVTNTTGVSQVNGVRVASESGGNRTVVQVG